MTKYDIIDNIYKIKRTLNILDDNDKELYDKLQKELKKLTMMLEKVENEERLDEFKNFSSEDDNDDTVVILEEEFQEIINKDAAKDIV